MRELRAGHHAAVAEALGYLEREAWRGRRGTDGVVQVRGEGLVGAAFVHRTSRAGDPLLHTHVSWGISRAGRTGAGRRSMAAISTAKPRPPAACIRRCCGAS